MLVCKRSSGGNGVDTVELSAGEHFGESALASSRAALRNASVIAATMTHLYCLNRADFFTVISDFPEYKRQFEVRHTRPLHAHALLSISLTHSLRHRNRRRKSLKSPSSRHTRTG